MRNPLKSLATADAGAEQGAEESAPPNPVTGGERRRYYHEQITPSSVWIIDHDLSARPQVTIYDVNGRKVESEVTHATDTRVEITHGSAIAGAALLLS